MRPWRFAAAAVGVGALLIAVSMTASPASAATTCHLIASPHGSDSGTGTVESPFRSAEKLVDSLAPGQVGCFRAGTYSFGTVRLETAGVTLAPYGTEPVTLAGHIKIYPAAANTVIEGMTLNASSSPDDPSGPKIYASGVVLRDNAITNDNTEICVMIGSYYDAPPPQGVVIERNRIHHCGALPATNLDHGIYISEARNPVVRDNWIYENADRGIQQYPDVQGAQITGNVIAGNGQGVNFSGSGSQVTTDATVAGNVVVDSKIGYNAYSGGDGPDGKNNFFRDNCVHALKGGSGIEPDARSFTPTDNLVANPAFVNAAGGDYRLHPHSPCLAKYTGTMSLNGAAPATLAPKTKAGKVKLRANRRKLDRGKRLRLRGRVTGALRGSGRIAIERRKHGRWKRMGSARVGRGGRFRVRLRPRRAQTLRVRAAHPGGRHSRMVRVKVRAR